MRSPDLRKTGARRRVAAALLGLALAAGLAGADGLAITGDLTKDPADIVKKYFDLDMKGARLESLSRTALKPYTRWKEEPAWGYVVVIQDFLVLDESATWEILGPLDVVIPVRFKVLGRMYWNTAAFIPEPRTEEVRVRVAAVHDRWRILEPQVPPHVGRPRLINYVRQAQLDATEQADRDALAALLGDLKRAGP
jgi:hypothetical protein